jgi:Holliday junction resolvase RusA-like endonuclease
MPEITVWDEPVPKARPRFAKGRVFTERRTELAEHRIREAWPHPCLAAGVPAELHVTVHLARPRSHFGTGRNAALVRPAAPCFPVARPDWDNYAKTVSDALNGVAYSDDGQVVSARVTKLYTTDRPHWHIVVCAVTIGGVQ